MPAHEDRQPGKRHSAGQRGNYPRQPFKTQLIEEEQCYAAKRDENKQPVEWPRPFLENPGTDNRDVDRRCVLKKYGVCRTRKLGSNNEKNDRTGIGECARKNAP